MRSLLIVLAAVAAWAVPVSGVAQSFPSKQVRIIMPFPPGGTGDVVARMISAPLTKQLGQNVIVDNRPGGGTIIGSELVARAAPDGHTLLAVFNSFSINPAVRPKLPYDTVRDFAPVTLVAVTPFVYAVHPSLPVKSLKEMVALAKRRPGELTYATPGLATGQHLAAEMLKLMAGIDLTHVPYQGAAPALTGVMGGHTSILLVNVSDVAPYSAQGRLRPLAVTTRTRSPAMKDVPTVAEVGYADYESALWIGLVAPGATPKDVVARLSTEVGRALQSAEVVSGLDRLGLTGAAQTPEQFGTFLRDEMRRNEQTARKANIRID